MKRYAEHLEYSEENASAAKDEISRRYCRGWAVASEEYRKELKAAFAESEASESLGGAEWADLRETRWEKLLSSLLRAARISERDVTRDAKSASWTVKIARELRAQSTATNAWIAQRLAMGHPTRVCNLIGNNV